MSNIERTKLESAPTSHFEPYGVGHGFKRNVLGILFTILPSETYCWLRAVRNQWRKSLSQVGQDFWITREAFNGKREGFFLEVGAADGITLSNCFILEKRFGWRGICIEPHPESFRSLRKVRSARCFNVCVGESDGEVEFFKEGLLSGMAADQRNSADRLAAGLDVISVKSRPLAGILREANAPRVIDYLSIDVEGAEERIFIGFPFSEYIFRTLTIERPSRMVREILTMNGYIWVKEIPDLDCFYIHESFREEYAENLFSFWGKYRA